MKLTPAMRKYDYVIANWRIGKRYKPCFWILHPTFPCLQEWADYEEMVEQLWAVREGLAN